jgi:fibronectin-binding autotransporter adhesin
MPQAQLLRRDARRLRRRSALAAAALAALAGSRAHADQAFFTYIGPSGGTWNSVFNWDPIGIPNAANTVAIVPGGTFVRLNSGPNPITIDKIAIGAGGQAELTNDFDLIIRTQTDGLGTTGLIGVPGILFLSSIGSATDLILSGPVNSYAVFGGGTPFTPALIQMSNTQANRIYGQFGHEQLIIQPAAVIQGAGNIGVGLLRIENQGTIRASTTAGITVSPAGTMFNSGVLEANGGTLTLAPGTYDNTSGDITAIGTDVQLQSAAVTGGTLTGIGPGEIRVISTGGGTRLTNTTLAGLTRLPNDADLTLVGTLTNLGALNMSSIGTATDLYLDGSLTLNGSGQVLTSNTQANRILDITSGYRGFTLTNVDNELRGSFQLGLNTLDIVNQATGLIEANSSSGVSIDPGASMVNEGVLRATNGAALTLYAGSYVFNGLVEATDGGVIQLFAGNFTGTVSTSGTGQIRVITPGASVRLQNLTSMGRLDMPNDADAVLSGTFTNTGTVNMLSIGTGTDFYLDSNLTIAGGGSIVMSNTQANRVLDITSGNQGRTLTNAGNTIRGAAQLGANTINFVNTAAGSIIAEGSSGMLIDPAVTFVNEGELRAAPGSSLSLHHATYTLLAPVVAAPGAVVNLVSGTFTGGTRAEPGGSVRITQAGAQARLSDVTSEGLMVMPNDADAVFTGTFTNLGVLSMESIGTGTDLYLDGPLTLAGGGLVVMSNTQANRVLDITGGNRGFTLINQDNTISGSGALGLNTLNIDNQPGGSIIASTSSGMIIDPGSTLINAGVLRAQGGATMALQGGSYTLATPATAGTGSTVRLDAGTYAGRFASEGTGTVRIGTAGAQVAFAGVTLDPGATMVVPNDADFSASGTITNHGTITFQSIGNGTDLYLSSNLMLNGGGLVTFSNTQANRIFDITGGNQGRKLVIADGSVEGAASIGLNTIDVEIGAAGAVRVTGSSGMTLDAAASLTNAGSVEALVGNLTLAPAAVSTSGQVLAAAGRLIWQQGGAWTQTGGVVRIDGEIQVDSNQYLLQDGLVSGVGRLDSNVSQSGGTVGPGNSAGLLTIEGTYGLGAGGAVEIELGGTTPGTLHDRLVVTGTATLAGELRLRLLPGYVPPIGTVFTVLTAGSVVGSFVNVDPPGVYSVSYTANTVVVTVVSGACPTDYNRDGFVNLDDLGDFITDFYLETPVPQGLQPAAPTLADRYVGYGVPCANAPDAGPPYAADAYRVMGYRVGFSLDGSNACPIAPEAAFPNLDNLGDYITQYYAAVNGGGC